MRTWVVAIASALALVMASGGGLALAKSKRSVKDGDYAGRTSQQSSSTGKGERIELTVKDRKVVKYSLGGAFCNLTTGGQSGFQGGSPHKVSAKVSSSGRFSFTFTSSDDLLGLQDKLEVSGTFTKTTKISGELVLTRTSSRGAPPCVTKPPASFKAGHG